MNKSKIKLWLRATRPFSFTASLIPVVLGSILSLGQYSFIPGYFILTIIGVLMLHVGVNLISDHDDFVNKVDTIESSGSSGVIVENLLSPEIILKAGKILLMTGLFIGLLLTFFRGWVVLLIGIIGAFSGYSYTGKPLALKYKGLGVLLVFILFGPLLVLGAYYVQAQTISLAAILVSVPSGLLTTAILHANDIRDIQNDEKAGIKTLSIILGRENAVKFYTGLLFFSYVTIILMAFYKLLPYWSLACILTIPEAFKCIKAVTQKKELITLDKKTGQLQGKFGVIFILSILIPLIIG